MLQRAASNAYSWWWASHIRTKQSKWLEQNLHDMEEKVRIVLKLIEEDGDSFAKRAEMYYKKRPELIQFVEESYRAYRALAERYDHLSTELQNANSTIAAVFPEQVQFAMDEEEEEASSLRFSKKPPEVSQSGNIPKVPKGLKNVVQAATKKMQATKSSKITSVAAAAAAVVAAKSGLTKTEALSEIDKLQKQILILQTEKEFVKSSYEGSLAQFQEIDLQIKEHQVRIFSLEDEFGEGIDIPNDDARNLMTATALKSCQETLDNLKVKQEKSVEEAETESRRIKEVRERIESLKVEFNCGDQIGPETKLQGKNDVVGPKKEKNPEDSNKEEMELSAESGGDLTVTEMAEKIDKLVNKVVGFEMAVSSQDALVSRLRTETDDILAQIRNLENDKESVIDGKNDLSVKVKEMEEKLREIQDLSSRVENKNNILQTHFTNTRCNLDKLSVKLPSLKPDEEVDHNKSQKAQNEAKLEIKVMEVSASIQTEQKEYPIVVAESPKDIIEQKESLESSKNSENVNIMTSIPPPYQAESSENAGVMPSTPPSHQAESSENADVLSITPSSHQAESSENGSAMPSTPSYQGNSSENADVMSSTPSHQEESSENAGVKSSTPPSYQATSSENTDVKSSTSPSYQATSSENTDVLTGSPPPHQAESSENADGMNSTPSNQVVEDNLDEKGEDPKVQEGEPDWRQLFMNGMQDKEKLLLTEYTTALRNYKELKKQLSEPADRGSQESTLDETSKQLKELEISNAIKDNEIQSLKQKLSLMQKCFYENKDSKDLTEFPKQENPEPEQEEQQQQKDENGHATPNSAFEERFRLRIDELLEENLEFWFQFSTSIQEIQKYETGIKDLLTEVTKLVQKQKAEGSSTAKYSLKSDARPIYKHLREIQTELTVWTEHSALLKGELQTRFSSLCNIQEEITAALKTSAEGDDFKFTSYQAAKFQGEVLNMKQENNRVADELQAGLDHGTTLQVEVEKALAKLNEEFQLSGSKKHGPESRDRPRVPLQSFIFGVKPKKQRPSILQCMNPAMYKKYHGMKSAPL